MFDMFHTKALGAYCRLIDAADMPFLASVYASTRAEELSRTGWPAAVIDQFLAQQFSAQHRHYIVSYPRVEMMVIVRSGKNVGRLTINETDDAVGLVDVALLPRERGRGTGSAILSDIMAYAAIVQKPVVLHVEQHNSAMRLYRRAGFVTVEEGPVYDRMEWTPAVQ